MSGRGWKGELLRTLYYETELVLGGGDADLARPERIRLAQMRLREQLPEWSDAEFEAYARRHYPGYWLKSDERFRRRHARFMREADAAGQSVATGYETDSFRGVTEITVVSPDHPRLLAIVTGACAAAGGNIVDAQIFTTADGMALDTIFLSRAFDRDEDELRRAERVAASIEAALKGEVKIADLVDGRRQPRERTRPFVVVPEIVIDNSLSSRFTVLEITGLDRPGLLYDLNHGARQTQPQHRLGSYRNLWREGRRCVLRHRSDRGQDHAPGSPDRCAQGSARGDPARIRRRTTGSPDRPIRFAAIRVYAAALDFGGPRHDIRQK